MAAWENVGVPLIVALLTSTATNAINGLSAIAKSGSVSDLTQPNDVVIVFNCGSSSTVI